MRDAVLPSFRSIARLRWLVPSLFLISGCDGCDDPQTKDPPFGTGGLGGGGATSVVGTGGQGVGGDGDGGSGGAPPVGESPAWPIEARIRIIGATTSTFTVAWDAATDNVAITGYRVLVDGVEVAILDAATLEYIVSGVLVGEYHLVEIEARDADGNATTGPSIHGMAVPDEPTAPPTDPGVPFGMNEAMAFLIADPDPVQLDIAQDALDAQRIAVVRGRVLQGTEPLPGVEITIKGQPELGRAISRADGHFEMIVNGGGQMFVEYRHPDFLASTRAIAPSWEDWAHLDDVVLLQRDPNATEIDLAMGGIAKGSEITDQDGARQARLSLRAGTTAVIRLPDGTTQPIDTLTIRITEFTVGDQGPAAMPASLPCFSAYTYAAAVTADEADAVGGTVELSTPASLWIENFLDIPVGSSVPLGSLPAGGGEWSGELGGKVVKVINKDADGKAHVDTDGDDIADDAGFSDEELEDIGEEFDEDDELSEVKLDALTTVDANYAKRVAHLPPNVGDPYSEDPLDDPGITPEPCGGANSPGGDEQQASNCEPGSKISVEVQSLGQAFSIIGTPYQLHYESAHTLGRTGLYKLQIPITADDVPAEVIAVAVEVQIAGRVESFTLGPPQGNLTLPYTWDGLDAWGRRALGRVPVDVNIDYFYAAQYGVSALGAFGYPSTATGLALVEGRDVVPVIKSRRWRGTIGAPGDRSLGLEGWSINAVHTLDRRGGRIYLGNGTERTIGSTGWVIDRLAGTGNNQYAGVPGPALDASFFLGADVDALPDGGFLITESYPPRILRVSPDGQISVAAGNGTVGDAGDGGPAIQAQLGEPRALAVGPDGSFYIASSSGCKLKKVDPDGIITTFAGNGACSDPPVEGGDAATTPFGAMEDVAVGCDGSVWVAEKEANRIRRIDPSGKVRTIIGGPTHGYAGDGGGADEALIDEPAALFVDGQCQLFFSDEGNFRIRSIDESGIVRTIAGNGTNARQAPTVGEGGPALDANLGDWLRLARLPDGTLLINDPFTRRILALSADGTIRRLAGTGEQGVDFDGRMALSAKISPTGGISVLPDGSVLSGGGTRILHIHRVPQTVLPLDEEAIPSSDGREIYMFGTEGRHLRTLDAFTGAVLLEMGYDQGRLTTLTDGAGRITTIERDANGVATAIVSATGQMTTLATDSDLNLTGMTNPHGQSHTFGYDPGGLMTSLVDPENNQHSFEYWLGGVLTADTGPTGITRELIRTNGTDGKVRIDVKTTLNRYTTYFVEPEAEGLTRRVVDPTGAQTIFTAERNGTQTIVRPDGTTIVQRFAPDPRWGMLAPFVSSSTVTSPGGVISQRTTARSIQVSDPSDVLSLVSLSDTIVMGGATTVRTADVSSRTLTVSPPAGSPMTVQFGTWGNVESIEHDPSFAPETFTFDPFRRVTARSTLGRSHAWSFDGNDRVATLTNGVGNVWSYTYDAANRPLSMLEPDGGLVGYGFDDNGFLISMSAPVSGTASMGRNGLGELTSFVPASGAGTSLRTYDLDGALDTVTLAGGRIVDTTFDDGARFGAMAYPEATVGVTYADDTSRPSTMSWTPTAGEAQSTSYTYDGSLLTQSVWSGPEPLGIDYAYGTEARLASRTVTSGSDVHDMAFTYRDDGAIIQAGPFSVERNGPASAPSRYGDGNLDLNLTFEPSGLLDTRTVSIAGSTVYSIALSYDAAAHVIEKVETIQGVTTTWTYSRSTARHLTGVSANGSVVESYAWDLGGNLTSRQLGALPPQSAAVDAQGRLTSLGGVNYGWDADGMLASRGADSFSYSARGELLAANIGGVPVTYGYDAFGRRTRRNGPGGTTRYYYGDLDHPSRVTHVRREDGALDALHYDQAGVLFAIDRGATRLYIACDLVGSPRLVLDGAGTVLRAIDYDSFGRIVADSNPSLTLPIGFAGGIPDPLTQLVRFGWRDYEPASGRFTARDPVRFRGKSRNLYAYVHSDPVGFVDPDGLFEIGASGYWGVGGGGSLAMDENGMSVCIEAGIGVGTSVDIDPDAASISGIEKSTNFEVSASAGPLGVTGKVTIKDGCDAKFSQEAVIGPIHVDSEEGVKVSAKPDDWAAQAIGGAHASLQAKLARKVCVEIF